jgi:phytoene dehydrogenase-like protein
MQKRYDALVVGAGPAGVTAALQLAALGRQVTLLDARPHIGGAIHAFATPDGPVDAGPHLLTGLGKGQLLAEAWQELGVVLPPLRSIRPAAEIVTPAGAVAPTDPATMRASLTTPHGRHALDVLLAAAHEMTDLPWDVGIPQFFAVPVKAPTFLKLLPLTLDGAFDLLEVPPEDRLLLGGYWGFVGMPPAEISAVFYAYLLRIYLEEGGWRPVDGLGALQAALAEALSAAGVDVQTSMQVTALGGRPGARQIQLAATAGAWHPARGLVGDPSPSGAATADLVVWTADPRPLAAMLGDAPARWRRCLTETQPTVAGVRGTWRLRDGGPDDRLDVRGDFVGEVRENGWLHRYGYLPAGSDGAAVAELQGRLAADLPIEARWTTPSTHAGQLGVADGALYGAAFGPDQVGFERIQPRTPWPDLFLAGHWTSPGSGVAGAALSGRRAALLTARRRPLLWRRTA